MDNNEVRRLRLPLRLEALLRKGDHTLEGHVRGSIGDFETWLGANRLVFFPEYTDHGISHVEKVLSTADWLLPDQAIEAMGAADAAVLILSVVLHDCAMHLSEDGFLRVIDRDSPWPPARRASQPKLLKGFDDRPWAQLWEEFLRDASRWDDQKLIALFGNSKSVRSPPPEPSAWDKKDHLLIGEFLRRHHPRLAHEIAVYGVPRPGEDRLQLTGIEPWMADLSGLIARSHGEDLRRVLDRFDDIRDRHSKGGVHVALLMSLLRIADYLEIDAQRAPQQLFKIRRLCSSISQEEWDKHAKVRLVEIDPYDGESLRIEADPQTAVVFAGLQDLFAGLQRELDLSWAVLGEVYKSSSPFGLKIRRIRSTLDNPKRLTDVPFVPLRARFDSAGANLLTLMVRPLYSDEPAYGVRELIQNAVDACREMEDLLGQRPELAQARASLEADVVVSVVEEKEGEGWITIEDRGIGMTAETIVDYFLKAGASLRDSDAWHHRHDDPTTGVPRVPRSGRFGLGVLATFLLGEEITVSTRHAEAAPGQGITFKAQLDSPLIELSWCDFRIGTTIKVHVTRSAVFDALAEGDGWDWYRLKQPSVKRRVQLLVDHGRCRYRPSAPSGAEVEFDHGEIVPHGEDPLPAPWRRLWREDYREILWSLQRETGWADVVNGLLLKRPDVISVNWRVLWPPNWSDTHRDLGAPHSGSAADFFLFRPRIAVMEGASRVPVDLLRTECLTPLPFDADLIDALCRDVLASLLVRAAESRREVLRQIARLILDGPRDLDPFESLWHPAISADRDEHGTSLGPYEFGTWLFTTPGGLTLEDPALGSGERCGVAFIIASYGPEEREGERRGYRFPDDALLDDALRRVPDGLPVGIQLELGLSFLGYAESECHDKEVKRLRATGYDSVAIVLPAVRWHSAKTEERFKHIAERDLANGWKLVWLGEDPIDRLDLARLCGEPPQEGSLAIGLHLLSAEGSAREPRNPLSRLWRQLLPIGEIPYEQALRGRFFADAFDDLKEEIGFWKRLMTAEPKGRKDATRSWINMRDGW